MHFPDFGVVSYWIDGAERWSLPLGPFRNNHGMGASAVVYRDLLIQICESEHDVVFFTFVDKNTGRVRRRIDRSEMLGVSYSTPTVYERDGQSPLLIVPGSFEMIAYRLDTGEKQWWLSGLPYSPRSVPVLAEERRPGPSRAEHPVGCRWRRTRRTGICEPADSLRHRKW